MNTQDKLLFITLDEEIQLCSLEEATDVIRLNGHNFRRESDFDAHAYYDWLRNRNGEILGLRLDLVEESQYIIEQIEHLDYVETENKKTYFRIVYLYFGTDRHFEPTLSADQAFWDCFLYFSENGQIALTFLLPAADIGSLRGGLAANCV